METKSYSTHLLIAALCGVGLLLPLLGNAETTVRNSVKVSADGGSSQASVRTIVDGVVVTDWSASSTEPISYSEQQTYPSSETTAKSSVATEAAQLEALLTQLQILISLYVTLTTH